MRHLAQTQQTNFLCFSLCVKQPSLRWFAQPFDGRNPIGWFLGSSPLKVPFSF
jgi:hypothetical protein